MPQWSSINIVTRGSVWRKWSQWWKIRNQSWPQVVALPHWKNCRYHRLPVIIIIIAPPWSPGSPGPPWSPWWPWSSSSYHHRHIDCQSLHSLTEKTVLSAFHSHHHRRRGFRDWEWEHNTLKYLRPGGGLSRTVPWCPPGGRFWHSDHQ